MLRKTHGLSSLNSGEAVRAEPAPSSSRPYRVPPSLSLLSLSKTYSRPTLQTMTCVLVRLQSKKSCENPAGDRATLQAHSGAGGLAGYRPGFLLRRLSQLRIEPPRSLQGGNPHPFLETE